MWTQEEGDAILALAGEELQPLYLEGLIGNDEKGKALGLQEWEFALALQFHKDAKPDYSMFEHILYRAYGVLRYKKFEKIKDESRLVYLYLPFPQKIKHNDVLIVDCSSGELHFALYSSRENLIDDWSDAKWEPDNESTFAFDRHFRDCKRLVGMQVEECLKLFNDSQPYKLLQTDSRGSIDLAKRTAKWWGKKEGFYPYKHADVDLDTLYKKVMKKDRDNKPAIESIAECYFELRRWGNSTVE